MCKLMISNIDYLKESWSLELNPLLEMTSFQVSSRKRVYWSCSACGYTYQRSIWSQYQNGGRCPRCEQLHQNKETSLAVCYPELAKLLVEDKNDGWTAFHVKPFSHRILHWYCPDCDSVYPLSVAHRVRAASCPCCTGRRVSLKNSLATLNPAAAAQWDYELNQGLTPEDVTANSNKEFWFRCQICHHAWLARCNARTAKKTGCPECAKRQSRLQMKKRHLTPYSNHIGVTHPMLAKQWHPTLNGDLPLSAIKSKSNRLVWWQCPRCLEVWEAKVISRTQTKKGRFCPHCHFETPLVEN